MIIDDFEVWMISITGNTTRDLVLQSWHDDGLEVNHFEAITPKDLLPELNFGKKMRDKPNNPIVDFTDTEKAIWCSHYKMWRLCLQKKKPLVIIEDDVILTSSFPPVWEVERLKYFVRSHAPDKKTKRYEYAWAAGYIITPAGATRAINRCTNGLITVNVDGFLQLIRDDNPAHNKGGWVREYGTTIPKPYKTIEHL